MNAYSDYAEIFRLGDYHATKVQHALIASLESQVILGPRKTGIFVGLSDDLSAITRDPGDLVLPASIKCSPACAEKAVLDQVWNNSDVIGTIFGPIS